MDRLGGLAIVTMAIGAAVGLVGLGIMIWRVRDDDGRTTGIRIAYAGMAGICLGMMFFIVSRPDEILPAPVKYLVVAITFVPLIRLATAAVRLRPPQRR